MFSREFLAYELEAAISNRMMQIQKWVGAKCRQVGTRHGSGLQFNYLNNPGFMQSFFGTSFDRTYLTTWSVTPLIIIGFYKVCHDLTE